MSRTDKTRPEWVQFRDPYNRQFMDEVHNHHKGSCDFDEWLTSKCEWVPYAKRWYHCYLEHSRWGFYGAWHGEFYERQGRRFNQWRMARAAWRRQRSQLLSGELDGDDLLVPQHKQYNSWKQEVWYD